MEDALQFLRRRQEVEEEDVNAGPVKNVIPGGRSHRLARQGALQNGRKEHGNGKESAKQQLAQPALPPRGVSVGQNFEERWREEKGMHELHFVGCLGACWRRESGDECCSAC